MVPLVVAILAPPPLAAKLAGIGHAAGPLLWLAPNLLWLRLLPWVPGLMHLRLCAALLLRRPCAELLLGSASGSSYRPGRLQQSHSHCAGGRGMHTMATAPPVNQRDGDAPLPWNW